MNAYLELRCSIPAALEEELPVIVNRPQVLGIEIGEQERGRVRLTVYFSPGAGQSRETIRALLEDRGATEAATGFVADEDWLVAYRETVRPFPVGELWWLDPHPDLPTSAPPGRRRIVMPPGMAFGSGSHESTRLMLEGLREGDVRGRAVLDVGTGSGVLALAAEILGARCVLGVDIDALAVCTAVEICALQEWQPSVHLVVGSAGCAGAGVFDLVMCNMIWAHSLPLLPAMSAALAPAGRLVLSGLLYGERTEVETKLVGAGMAVVSVRRDGEWISLTAERRR